MESLWLQTDEADDVRGSLRHAVQCAELAKRDPHAWKWMMLALHSALQGACVCHLTTTAAPVGAVSDKNAAEWLEYFEKSRTDASVKPPRTFLLSLPGLLKKIRKPFSVGDRSLPDGIAISEKEIAWLNRLHEEIRNQFVHFEPMGWSIELSGIPEYAQVVARIITDILAAGYAFRHLDQTSIDAMRREISDLARAAS